MSTADLALHVTISIGIVTAWPLCLWAGLLHDSETSRPPSQGWDEPAVARHGFGEVAK